MYSEFKHPQYKFKELSLRRTFFFKNTGIRVSFTKMLSGCQATPDRLVGDDLKGGTRIFAEEKKAKIKRVKKDKKNDATQSI